MDHLLARLKGLELFDGDEHVFSDEERCSLVLENEAIYRHKILRVNYTTYDLRRDQDSVNPRTHADVMVAAHEDDEEANPHPYWYARVIGIFHTSVLRRGDSSPPKRMEFLWVRWYGRDLDHGAGWKTRRLHRVGFIASQDPAAYGFLDPALVIRTVHLIPAFELGRTTEYLSGPVTRPAELKYSEWRQFYVNPCVPLNIRISYLITLNRFVDRDMFMRFRGGGVGHKSTREATNQCLQDRHPTEAQLTSENIEDEDMEPGDEETTLGQAEGDEDGLGGDKGNENGADKDNEIEAGDENDENEQETEMNEEESLGPEDGEDHDEDEDVGYDVL